MSASASTGKSSQMTSRAQPAPRTAREGVSDDQSAIGERSLYTLSLIRIFVGLLWFQQLAWKMPPSFGGLRSYVMREALHPLVPGYGFLITHLFLPNFTLLGVFVWTSELLVGLSLLLGVFTRFGALLSTLLAVQLYIGLAYAPGEWYWTYGMLVLLGVTMIAAPVARRLSLDRALIPWLRVRATRGGAWRALAWLAAA